MHTHAVCAHTPRTTTRTNGNMTLLTVWSWGRHCSKPPWLCLTSPKVHSYAVCLSVVTTIAMHSRNATQMSKVATFFRVKPVTFKVQTCLLSERACLQSLKKPNKSPGERVSTLDASNTMQSIDTPIDGVDGDGCCR